MQYKMLALAAAAILFASPARAQDSEQRREWNQPALPFRIIDNVYYVGTSGLAAYLITDPAGHVLIDGGLPESADLIAANVEKLGFRLTDIRYLLINHAHFDHSGGLAALKRRTGATMVALAAETPDLEAGRTSSRPELGAFAPVKVDRVIADKNRLRLGGIDLTAHWTPGHTRGCTSWAARTPQHNVLFACSLTVAGQRLIDNKAYPAAARDFERTFARLRALKADVFLNFHPEFFALQDKRAQQLAGNSDAFVNPGELSTQVARAENAFRQELERQRSSKR